MDAARDPLAGLLGSVSDGDTIDWDAVVRRVGPDDLTLVEALRDVDRIGSFSRGLQRAGAGEHGPDAADPGGVPRWGELLLLERLGRGAYAEVWRAWDPRLRREVALKLLQPQPGSADEAGGESPLLAEGRALARVRHPHVLAVHDIDRHDGRVGLSMELARGQTLEQQVAAGGPLGVDDALQLGREIGSALAAVHAAGLLHRDVKPANVVRDADGRWLLADFGLGVPQAVDGEAAPLVAGSPMYMAPELLLGAAPDARTDVYALGLLVWFALTGSHPFGRITLAQLRAASADGPRPPLRERRPGLAPGLLAAVEGAISPSASRRTASASAFVAALEGCRDGTDQGARRRGLRLAKAAAAGLLVIALALAAGQLAQRREAGPAAAGAYDVEAVLMRRGNGPAEPLATGAAVAPGDRLSLRWRGSRPLWVYVVNADDRGESFLLFPQPQYAARNPLPGGVDVDLPGAIDGRDFAWTVTSAGGRETFLVVASPEPVPELEGGASGLAAPSPAGAVRRLRGVGGLEPVGAGSSAPAAGGKASLARFRALAGRESGVTGVWVREIVLRNPG